jgi:hypothetical protein
MGRLKLDVPSVVLRAVHLQSASDPRCSAQDLNESLSGLTKPLVLLEGQDDRSFFTPAGNDLRAGPLGLVHDLAESVLGTVELPDFGWPHS